MLKVTTKYELINVCYEFENQQYPKYSPERCVGRALVMMLFMFSPARVLNLT